MLQRDVFVDQLKGYACLLVLLGHVLLGLISCGLSLPAFLPFSERFIMSFHIDLFMFLAGYVYHLTGDAASKGSRLRFIGNKLLNLGLPYFFFSAVYIAINSLTPGVNTTSSLSDILQLWRQPVAQYWFLFSLFWLFVFWVLLSRFFNNITITAVLFTVFTVLKYLNIDLGFLDSSMHCVLAFGLGTCLRSLAVQKLPAAARIAAILLHILIVSTLFLTNGYYIFLMDDVATLLGIFASLCLISLIARCKPIAVFLQFVCKYSFPIYLLHTIFTSAIRICLLKVSVTNYWLHLSAGILCGLAFPVLIAKLAAQTPYLNVFFYPSHALRQIRTKHSKKETAL